MPDAQRVILTIQGEQIDPDGTVNEIELITEGSIIFQEDVIRLVYRETEMVGTDGSEMTIELLDGAVRVFREGDYASNFYFRQGQRCVNLYSTPFGTVEMGAFPSEVCYDVGDGVGEVHLCYELDMQGHSLGRNRLTMAWRDCPIC